MRASLLVVLLSAVGCASVGAAPPASDLDRSVRTLDRGSGVVSVEAIGESREGRPVHVLRLAAEGEVDPGDRPALLIVAGANGDHLVGTDVAMGVAERLVAEHGELLSRVTVYVAPRLNPDAAARHGEGPRRSFARTVRPDDADGDGRVDEDGPADLNGDGVVTMMRIEDPPAWLGASLVVDESEPRLMRAPKPEEGERATHAVLVEGIDDDGDGVIGEDPVGGVLLDMNFPHHWPEHEDGAGPHQLSEPPARALVEWMLDRRNVAAVLVFGPHDTLASVPESGQMDDTGAVPTGIEEDDKPYYEKVSEVFKGITKMTGAPGGARDGSFHAWAYAQYGVPSFSTPVWVRPDLLEGAEGEEEEGEGGDEAAQPEEEEAAGGLTTQEIRAMVARFESADEEERQELMAEYRELDAATQRRVMAVAQGQPDPAASDDEDGGASGADPEDRKWLAYSDEQRGGAGFVEWAEFEHPEFGTVEVGGFVPGFRMNPPEEEVPRLVDEQTRFVVDLAGRLPRVRVAEPVVERLGAGVWRVSVEVVNEGYFPTQTAMAEKVRRVTPTVMTLDVDEDAVLGGELVQSQRGIDGGGGRARAEWLVAGGEGETVTVVVRSATLGEVRVGATLEGE